MEQNDNNRFPSAPDGRHTLKALVVAVGIALGTVPLSARAGAMISIAPELVTATRSVKSVVDQKAWPAMITAPSRDLLLSSARREMVFIDPRVPEYEKLLADIDPGADVVVLDERKDGLRQIADALAGKRNLGSIHLISHGEEGALLLGRGEVREETLKNHRAELKQIGMALAPGGDLLLYGCDVASGAKGQRFIDRFAQLTGADVAASNNRTGAEGDWELEITHGDIEARPVLAANAMAAYDHSLATLTVTSNADNGVGTLRQAITDAAAGDTITFNAPMTIPLSTVLGTLYQCDPDTSLLLIDKDLTIDGDLNNDGVPDVTLDGQNLATVLRIGVSNVTLAGLTIAGGLSAGGGGTTCPATGYFGRRGGDARGAGVRVTGGAVTIVDSAITGNHAAGGGASSWPGGGGGGAGWSLGEGGVSYDQSQLTRGTVGVGANGYTTQYGGGGGKGGSSGASGTGGIGGLYYTYPAYRGGGAGGTAGSAALGFIGGGGGGATIGGLFPPPVASRGGNAAGAMYIAPGATVYLANTAISDNLAAGGGGNFAFVVGDGGAGVGGIDNRGTLHYEDATVTRSNNFGAGGQGGGGYGFYGAEGWGSNTGNEWLHGNAALNDFDPVAPTVHSIARHTPATALTNADSLTFDVTFSEPMATPSASDFAISGSTAQVSNIVLVSGNTWTMTISGGDLASANGTVTLGIASGHGITDMQGRAMVNTTPSGAVESYILDNVATVSIATPAAAITDTQPTFSGTAEMGAVLTLTLDGVNLGPVTVDSAGNWSMAAPTTLALGSHSVTLNATDALGNSGSTTLDFVVQPPAESSNASGGGSSGSSGGGAFSMPFLIALGGLVPFLRRRR